MFSKEDIFGFSKTRVNYRFMQCVQVFQKLSPVYIISTLSLACTIVKYIWMTSVGRGV